MSFDTSVVIGTFGDLSWVKLAEARAKPSVPEGIPIHHHHAETLAQSRNAGLAAVGTEWVIHLDADDELGPGYIEAMAKGGADMRVPMRQSMRLGQPYGPPFTPNVWGHTHDCTTECLRYGNWMVIGTCVRTEAAQAVGWEEFEWSEDWAMFARIAKAGATAEHIKDALYIAHMGTKGHRNRVPRNVSLHWHKTIEAAVWPDEPSVL